MRAGQVTCVDMSRSRLRRLRDVLDAYMPKSYVDDGRVRLVHGNGAIFVAEEEAKGNSFDRVGFLTLALCRLLTLSLPIRQLVII